MTRKPTSTNSQNQIALRQLCVLNDTLYRIGMRWKMQVLHGIGHGHGSFSSLKSALPEVTDQVLARRLKELVAEGLVRRCEAGTPAASSYTVTPRGRALLDIMASLCAWELSAAPEPGLTPE